ncbi:ester cyclase [Cerasicoccus fimbriatus]|uniref:ester cyclase n=1 Tax=Cerasicoccus fimbriatus TaxID=3014554 RepID=UPI0022B5A232|nr:ester cyclase [Cerasicoccus sp. TK19100]
MSPVELTHSWFRRVWNEQEEAAIHELLHPETVIEGLNLPAAGPEGFLPFYRTILENFQDHHVEVLQVVEQDGLVAGHAVFTGIHRATKTPVAIEFSLSLRWQNGQIIECKNVIDYLPMLSQLKLFSQETLGEALGLLPPKSK